MLVTDNSNGAADGKEDDQLQAMVDTGLEFITYSDHESTVQKSGEFVLIDRKSEDAQPRFVLLHETAMQYDTEGADLTGNELLTLAPNRKLHKRSRLYVSEIDPTNGDLPFREVSGLKTSSRIPRHHGMDTDDHPHQYPAVCEANYTAQAGKRRLFSMGGEKLMLVREVTVPGDPRYFNDSMRELVAEPQPHTKKRGLRAARVEVVELNPINGATGKVLLTFDIHSGLGFDPTPRSINAGGRSTAEMYDATRVFAAFAGVNYGSSLNLPSSASTPGGGDASDTYAVAEPSRAKDPDGREYTSLVAVYAAADDVYDSQGSGAFRLTCKRTTALGGVALTKITFPALPSHLAKHYMSPCGMSLHRLTPQRIVLRVNMQFMQFGAGYDTNANNFISSFIWSDDNGATWTQYPGLTWYFDMVPYGGVLVESATSLLTFSWFVSAGTQQVSVSRITATGAVQIGHIQGATFSGGLMAATHVKLVSYKPVGFGGATYRKTTTGKAKRLWMQFDPYWVYAESKPFVLSYPGSRPMLLVSDDGGATWARRFLPSVWSFRVGFVVAIGESLLAVPVYSARPEPGKALRATIYISKDGGDTWRPSDAGVTLPGETWVDGQTIIGAQYQDSSDAWVYEQDLNDADLEFNRGELHPLVAMRDADAKLLPANPARPWMNDHNIEEPDYA